MGGESIPMGGESIPMGGEFIPMGGGEVFGAIGGILRDDLVSGLGAIDRLGNDPLKNFQPFIGPIDLIKITPLPANGFFNTNGIYLGPPSSWPAPTGLPPGDWHWASDPNNTRGGGTYYDKSHPGRTASWSANPKGAKTSDGQQQDGKPHWKVINPELDDNGKMVPRGKSEVFRYDPNGNPLNYDDAHPQPKYGPDNNPGTDPNPEGIPLPWLRLLTPWPSIMTPILIPPWMLPSEPGEEPIAAQPGGNPQNILVIVI